MNIKEILAKAARGEALTAEEQKALAIYSKEVEADDADADATDADADDADADDEDVDEEAVKKMIRKSSKDVLEKQTDAIASMLVDKIDKQIKSRRAKANADASKDVNADNVTHKFLKALFEDDRSTLKEMEAERRKAVTTSDADTAKGGYLIPAPLEAEVMRIADDVGYGIARREMLNLPFNGPGNTRKIPTLGSSVTAYWTDEASNKLSSQPVFGLVTQTLKKLTAMVPMTEEIVEDSAVNLTSLVAELIAEAFAIAEDSEFLNGDGTVWTGIINNANVNIVALGATDRFSAGNITLEDLQAVIDATPASVLARGKWYLHRTILSSIRLLKDGAGAYIFVDPRAGQPATLLGYPVEMSEAMPAKSTLTAVDEPGIMFGDLRKAAVYGEKQGIRFKLLEEATIRNVADSGDLNLALQDMVAIRAVKRVGYVVALPTAVTVLTNGAT